MFVKGMSQFLTTVEGKSFGRDLIGRAWPLSTIEVV